MRTKGVGYIMAGSLSHLNEGCVVAKRCARLCFPDRGIHCVTVSSNMSDRGNRDRVTPFGGVVGR